MAVRFRLTLLAAVAMGLGLAPGNAEGHAAIVSSQPRPGQQLTTAPGVVSLRFTEPMNVKLSRAMVTDPHGQQSAGAAAEEREIRVRLSTNAVGIYHVSWTTVSIVDGHTLQGRFEFGVGVQPGGGDEGVILLAPQASDYGIALARTLEYGGLLMTTGMLLLEYLARRKPPLNWVRLAFPMPLAVALVSGIAVVLGEALTAASAASPGAVLDYLGGGPPGIARIARLVAEVFALAASFAWARFLPVPLAIAVISLAGAGHAAAIGPAWWGIGADSMHLTAGGVWAGGILAFATLRPPGGWRGAEARALLDRFSPVALVAFLLTVGSGALRGIQELSEVADLVTSSYGQVLSAKVLAVLAMIPLSLLAWRRRLVAPRVEATVAIAVIGAAALLAVHPLPPGRVREAEALREQSPAGSALPGPADLTLGNNAGEVLVGLTLRPGNPGRNEVLTYLLPLEGETRARDLRAELVMNGRSIEARECGPTCRSAQVDVHGGERLEVRVGGTPGGTAAFDLPPLPVPDGGDLVERMRERMRRVRTLRFEELLGPAEGVPGGRLRTEYEMQAPDRLRYEISSGAAAVWIGTTRWLRDQPNGAWRGEEAGITLPVPSFVWDPPAVRQLVAARVLGTAEVDRVNTQILAFFSEAGSLPVWFRVWVDADGLARRAEMRAPGHFMDHRYSDFDAPFSIEPPR